MVYSLGIALASLNLSDLQKAALHNIFFRTFSSYARGQSSASCDSTRPSRQRLKPVLSFVAVDNLGSRAGCSNSKNVAGYALYCTTNEGLQHQPEKLKLPACGRSLKALDT